MRALMCVAVAVAMARIARAVVARRLALWPFRIHAHQAILLSGLTPSAAGLCLGLLAGLFRGAVAVTAAAAAMRVGVAGAKKGKHARDIEDNARAGDRDKPQRVVMRDV